MKLEDQVVSLELAKQLKEAEYPQESLFYWWKPEGEKGRHILLYEREMETSDLDNAQSFSAPTVSELGKKLLMLKKRDDLVWVNMVRDLGEMIDSPDGLAKTWLALKRDGLLKENNV